MSAPETLAEASTEVSPEAEPKGVLGEALFSAFLVIVAAVFLVRSLAINSNAEPWPRSLAGLLLLLALVQLARSLRPVLARSLPLWAGDPQRVRRRLMTALWLLAYCLLAPWAGFGLTTLAMMPLYLLLSGERRLWVLLMSTAVTLALIWLLFGTVADVPVWEIGL